LVCCNILYDVVFCNIYVTLVSGNIHDVVCCNIYVVVVSCNMVKTREFQTQLLHYFSKSDNKSNHHHTSNKYHPHT